MDRTITIIGKEFSQKVIPLIKQARDSIDIIVYDWRWYPDQIGSDIQRFNNAIVTARKKGIKVRAITNSQQIIAILKESKIEAKKLFSYRKLHIKLMILDNKIAIFGSHNYTMSAFTTNLEVSIATQNENVVNRFKSLFNNLWLS